MSPVRKPLIYLASPYTSRLARDTDRSYEESRRFDVAREVAHLLHAAGYLVFSPIAYSHQFVSEFSNVGGCWDTWKEWDCRLLSLCDEVWVLTLSGWETSRGVRAECELARSLGKPVATIAANDLVPEYEVM